MTQHYRHKATGVEIRLQDHGEYIFDGCTHKHHRYFNMDEKFQDTNEFMEPQVSCPTCDPSAWEVMEPERGGPLKYTITYIPATSPDDTPAKAVGAGVEPACVVTTQPAPASHYNEFDMRHLTACNFQMFRPGDRCSCNIAWTPVTNITAIPIDEAVETWKRKQEPSRATIDLDHENNLPPRRK